MLMKGFKKIYFDVMMGGRFLFQITYVYSPLFNIDLDDVTKKVLERRPSLEGKRFEICMSNNKVI